MGLAPVVVRPAVQSREMGSQLIREGSRRCEELGYDYCVILGNPEYYGRFGFEPASNLGIDNEYGVNEEFMIVRSSARPVAGLVKYVPEIRQFCIWVNNFRSSIWIILAMRKIENTWRIE